MAWEGRAKDEGRGRQEARRASTGGATDQATSQALRGHLPAGWGPPELQEVAECVCYLLPAFLQAVEMEFVKDDSPHGTAGQSGAGRRERWPGHEEGTCGSCPLGAGGAAGEGAAGKSLGHGQGLPNLETTWERV